MSDHSEAAAADAGSLRKRVEKSGAIFIGGFGLRQALRLCSNLILTRLLMPEAFGLMATAVSVNILAIMITDISIGSSVIRSRNSHDPGFLQTAWTIRIVRNFIVWGLIVLLAIGVRIATVAGVTPAHSNFADPLVPWIMITVGADLLITAFASTNKAVAERTLATKRVIGVELLQQACMTGVTIAAAFAGMGVWSFVIGTLTGSFSALSSSYLFFPGPPMKFRFVRAYAMEILHFGKWLIIASFFGFVTNRGDQVIFGWLLEKREFGLYAVATIWIMAAFQLMETITRRVFYPAFSEVLRMRPKNIGKAYRQSRLALDAGAAFLAFSGYFLAEPILDFIYPADFEDVSYYLRLLLPIIILFPYRLLNYVILADGNSKIFTLITVITSIAMLTGSPIIISTFGVKAGVIFIASLSLTTVPVALWIVRKLFPIDWLTEGRIFILAAVLIGLLAGMEPRSVLGQ